MKSRRPQAAAGPGTTHARGVIHVPSGSGERAQSAAELAHLSQSERATRVLEQDRGAREIPIDRAFLEAALDVRRTLRTLVAAVVPRFADWCFVDLLDGDGIPRRVEVAHADPAKASIAQEMRSIGFGPGWATPGAQTVRDRTPRLYREVTEEIMTWATHGERHLAVLRAIKPNSLISVPLVARDRAIGALTLIRSAMTPGLDEQALRVAEELAVPAALALDNARWYQAERAARGNAEELADRERADLLEAQKAVLRLRRLESLAASLSGVLPSAAIARVVTENALSLLEPSSVTVVRASASGESLEVVQAQGWPDDLVLEVRELKVDGPALVAEAFRTQTAIWLSTEEALGQSYPSAQELPRRIGDRAWAAVPLRVDGRSIGAIALGFPRPRDLDADERRFVLTVAQLAAQALERARLRELTAL